MHGFIRLAGAFSALLFLVPGCGKFFQPVEGSIFGDPKAAEWLLPVNEIYDGGPGKDGIPALTNPVFVKPSEEDGDYLSEDDLIIGLKIGGEVRAYPHSILDYHEIINDEMGELAIAITYCPLTGSGIGWNRTLNGQVTTFGVSGLLYNSNLIPYDRGTESAWSQMKLLCVFGDLQSQEAELVPIVETTWQTWLAMYPETKVVSSATGYSRPYGSYPYGNYRDADFLIFPISTDDRRLPRKERVHGLFVGDRAKVYRLGDLDPGIAVINDSFRGAAIVLAGSSEANIAVSFQRQTEDGSVLAFQPLEGSLPAIMVDDEGTTWDVFGNGISGPRTGERLIPTRGYTAYWFAWGTFFPGAEIHGQ